MLIAVERLFIRLRQPASRAHELIELRQRLREELAAQPDDDERALAHTIRDQKLRVSKALTGVASCSTCATGQPFPRGHYNGGDCCSGETPSLFDDNELAMLVHAGTRARDLVPPRADHAGCAFRGPEGCTLEAEHRPARCVHYVCTILRRELHSRGALDAIEAELAELDRQVQQFRAVRSARVDREVVAELFGAIEAARSAMRTAG